jgi:hypothetical protein
MEDIRTKIAPEIKAQLESIALRYFDMVANKADSAEWEQLMGELDGIKLDGDLPAFEELKAAIVTEFANCFGKVEPIYNYDENGDDIDDINL